ncbi:phage resistance protein [Baekduia sp. Peel2402]|uniref:phage resistance protein n=1 Tax=Baekduia sp. Peel2402 TaxID=3458296 RepID=UPI00403EECE5
MSTAPDAQPLLRDLIDIPEQVSASDLVTELVSAVAEAQQTVDEYVVTPQLAEAFDRALGLVALSATDARSRATFLHGSFGAGKSHFMAVLHLLLQGDPHARAKPDLQAVVHRHDGALDGKKWLLVPYHMISATSLEQGVLGGYAKHVRALHPEAPEPAVFRDQDLFANARDLRDRLGDVAFFEALGAEQGGGGFGRFGGTAWTAQRFEAAMEAPPASKERTALQSALLSGLLSAMRGAASGDATQYVGIDDGLAIITQHAKDLGYDGLVLFLDELILWLASHLSDESFVANEASKIPKLRESGNAARALPIVSFVARQRDLREFVGRDSPGAQQAAFADTLDWGEGRFETVQLEDQNLPEIARQRVLAPKTPEAAALIDAAFRDVTARTAPQLSVLLTSTGTVDQFRATYPFSPALMQVLVALSSALQRNRTALKVLKTLLAERRDELRLGDLVGVGEIWDVVLDSPEPFSAALANQAEQARRLYREKLRPMLLEEQALDEDSARDVPWSHPFRANDRLIKTLLIAALVPSAEPVRDLTVSRLAALNHGSVRSRIQGNETAQLLGRLHTWSSKVGELKVGEDPNDPTVGIALSGVDVQSVLDGARAADSPGTRRQKVRELVFALLEVDDTRLANQLTLSFFWRGTARLADVRFGNVRDEQDITSGALRPSGDNWCLVVDFPFDGEGFRPADDLARLEHWRDANPEGARTIVWIPSFFSGALQTDLGRFVIHDHVLAGDGFRRYAAHLSEAEQTSARRTLETQRDALRARVRMALMQAYGLQTPSAEFIDISLLPEEGEAGIVRTLLSGFEVQRPVGAGLRDAAERLLGQGLEHELPGHPEFRREPKTRDLTKVLELLRDAMQQEGGRLVVQDRSSRELLGAAAEPMGFGDMGETAFVLKDRWVTWLEQKLAGEPRPTVEQLRAWLDTTDLQGIPSPAQDLAAIAIVEQAGRRFAEHGGPVSQPVIGRLSDGWEVVDQPMPSKSEWTAAVERSKALFGLVPIEAYASQAVGTLAVEIRDRMTAAAAPLLRLETELRGRGAPADGSRVRTTQALASFATAVSQARDDVELLRSFGSRDLEVNVVVAAVVLAHPDVQEALLVDPDWTTVDQLRTLTANGDVDAAALLGPLDEALSFDELAAPLEPRLRACARAGRDLIASRLAGGSRPAEKAPGQEEAATARSVSASSDSLPSAETVVGSEAAHAVIDRLTEGADDELEFSIQWRVRPPS